MLSNKTSCFWGLHTLKCLAHVQKAYPNVSLHQPDRHTSHFPTNFLKITENKHDLGFYVIKQDIDISLQNMNISWISYFWDIFPTVVSWVLCFKCNVTRFLSQFPLIPVLKGMLSNKTLLMLICLV